jgi:hypothetical protein
LGAIVVEDEKAERHTDENGRPADRAA